MEDALSVPGQNSALIQSILSASASGIGDYEQKITKSRTWFQ